MAYIVYIPYFHLTINGLFSSFVDFDYNEPCFGKYQCDHESAAAKSIIRSFIYSGNDLLDIDDIFKALHYGYGMKDSKVALIQVDTTNTVTGDKISNITSHHSIQFHNDHDNLVQFWHWNWY